MHRHVHDSEENKNKELSVQNISDKYDFRSQV